VKASEPEAWGRLVDLYSPLVYHWCRQCGLQAEDAADVAQDVFAAVAGSVALFRREGPDDSFRAWLWTVARNKIRDHFRRRKGQPQAQGGSDAQWQFAQLPGAPPSKSTGGRSDDQISLGHRLLAHIRARFEEHTWQAFWRTAVGGESGAETAAELGMSVQAVYQAKYRVLNAIRQEMGDLL
jgi:RNA polymerase sigma-70 factor (ECF subfamily)